MECDFVGGDFDWSIAPNCPKSPVFAPAALRGTRFGLESRAVGPFFLPKVVVFGVLRGTISSRTCNQPPRGPSWARAQRARPSRCTPSTEAHPQFHTRHTYLKEK